MIPTSFGSIRHYQATDADALVKHANSRAVWLNMRDAFPHPYTQSSAQAFLENCRQQNPKTFFAIATPQEAIGGIGLHLHEDVHRLTAEIGYWLGDAFWGKGIMTETLTKFTDFALNEFQLVRIHAEPYANNAASCRVLEKSGYLLEGRLKNSAIKDGRILDQVVYARIRAL
jgi:RimJ/RimL family protein N-acetyltransferase